MEAYKKDKEFMELVGHLIQHPRFQKLDNIPQHHYSTRMEHSINVAYTSYKIAKCGLYELQDCQKIWLG